mmetsp:Transcript_27608/g.49800  ORF Transcript_27608/g.49800 Transcript_27608/m.49800 type:complete len:220 (+) Transcript_27608:552-1211(+)
MSVAEYSIILLVIAFSIYCCSRVSPPRRDFPRPQARYNETECILCLDEIQNEVQATCGHLFCARCILAVWEHNNAKLACPTCRGPIAILFANFEESDSESTHAMLEVSRYNCLYAEEERTWWKLLSDSPFLLRRFFTSLSNPSTFTIYMKLLQLVILAFVYLLVPYDIIPDTVIGIVGLIDDLIIIGVVLLYVANATYEAVLDSARARIERDLERQLHN